jgi:ubiquinone/menaquinone biosynthesis C-methylase UbiE
MLALANANAAKSGLANVEFYKATIDKLPLPAASVDCVISNCVINLAPDKPAVFREIARRVLLYLRQTPQFDPNKKTVTAQLRSQDRP